MEATKGLRAGKLTDDERAAHHGQHHHTKPNKDFEE
jgi:hypothetical protein